MALTMTSLQHQHNLSIGQDDMEISSDAGRQPGDDDILIDVDVDVPPLEPTREEFMVDDDHLGAQDDVMFDDHGGEEIREEVMEEDTQYYDQDEELQDVTEEIYAEDASHIDDTQNDQTLNNTVTNGLLQNSELTDVTDVAYETAQMPKDGVVEFDPQDEHEETQYFEADSEVHGTADQDQHAEEGVLDLDAQQGLDNVGKEVEPPNEEDDGEEAGTVIKQTLGGEIQAVDSQANVNRQDDHDPDTHPTNVAGKPGANVELSERAVSDLHPVTVVWGDAEVSLFPKDSYSQYFLQDPSLAEKSLSEFLSACRSVLSDDLPDEIDLEAEFELLDLRISENSPDSTASTLADILQIYVQLCINDGLEQPDPLRVIFNAKPSFTSRLSALFDSLSQGHGLSQINSYDSEDEELETTERNETVQQGENQDSSDHLLHTEEGPAGSNVIEDEGELESERNEHDAEVQHSVAEAKSPFVHEEVNEVRTSEQETANVTDGSEALEASNAVAEPVTQEPVLETENHVLDTSQEDTLDYELDEHDSTDLPNDEQQQVENDEQDFIDDGADHDQWEAHGDSWEIDPGADGEQQQTQSGNAVEMHSSETTQHSEPQLPPHAEDDAHDGRFSTGLDVQSQTNNPELVEGESEADKALDNENNELADSNGDDLYDGLFLEDDDEDEDEDEDVDAESNHVEDNNNNEAEDDSNADEAGEDDDVDYDNVEDDDGDVSTVAASEAGSDDHAVATPETLPSPRDEAHQEASNPRKRSFSEHDAGGASSMSDAKKARPS